MTMVYFFRSMIPALIAVYIAMNMLSPVIIFGCMFAYFNRFIVSTASSFSLFSNATTPNNCVSIKNFYLSAVK